MAQLVVGGQPVRRRRPRRRGRGSARSPRSATDSALRAFCSTSSTVRPVRSRSARSTPMICATSCGARPSDGSSSSSSVGRPISARPIASIWRSPPDSVLAGAARALRQPREQLVDLRRAPPRASARSRRHSAPRRRFSSTVSSAITPRPSGTCAMPRRTMSSTARRLDLAAVEADAPRARADEAGERAQQRRLAGPVRAQDRGDGARGDLERDPVERADRPVRRHQVLNLEHRRPPRPR